ncbi:MAG TPA: cupin domain-containing protein [Chloroflexota bacterium]|jgi:quercetin dioxygenase-like cupin family protein|nr:cupin domain-containing protein [Chloroflexota bacterium]
MLWIHRPWPRRHFCAGLACLGVALGLGGPRRTGAQSPGVDAQILARGQADFAEELGGPADIVMAQIRFEPGASLPWHQHPGPVRAVITRGALSIYGSDGCRSVYPAGVGVTVPLGTIHFERNDGDEPVELVATYIVPPGSPLRVDAPASTAACAT